MELKESFTAMGGKGVVDWHLRRGVQYRSVNPFEVISAVERGLPLNELEALGKELDLSADKVAPYVGIPKATLHRRRKSGFLSVDESDKVVRIARILGKAIEVFGSNEQARKWLTTGQFGLRGEVPLKVAQTEVGAREVEDLLGRIEYGVYS